MSISGATNGDVRPPLKLKGVITALVTPFLPDGTIDWKGLEHLVESNIQQGVNGVVPCGTTGESPVLNNEEHDQVVAFVTKVVNKRVPVIAGTGSNCTQEAVERTQNAKASGVDAVLSVNPYYNKPNQKGLIEHFKQIGKVGVPIVLYNIPGRTNINMTPQTVKELYESVPEIIAIKEATGNLDQASEIAAICPGITILSGDDSLTLPLMSVGASGVISVLSNLSPKLVLDIVEPILKSSDFVAARTAHLRAFGVARSMFQDPNPCPVKLAMWKKGVISSPFVRLPLVVSDEKTWTASEAAIAVAAKQGEVLFSEKFAAA